MSKVRIFISCFVLAQAGHGSVLLEMGERLHTLRAEIESEAQKLEMERKTIQATQDVLIQQKSELELQIKKEELKSLQLTEKRKALTSKLPAFRNGKGSQSKDALVKWADRLTRSIENSLPYQRQKRLNAVFELKKRILQDRESDLSLASDLWRLTEEELQLAKQNEYSIGKIDWKNQAIDAEIVRLGRLQMYFVSSKGVVGKSVHRQGNWLMEAAQTAEEEKAIRRLVSHFKDRRKSGWFELPGLQHKEIP